MPVGLGKRQRFSEQIRGRKRARKLDVAFTGDMDSSKKNAELVSSFPFAGPMRSEPVEISNSEESELLCAERRT
jgi:hypothetical protein